MPSIEWCLVIKNWSIKIVFYELRQIHAGAMFTINSFSVLGMNVEEDFLSSIFSLLCRKCIFEASQETLNYTIDSRRLHKPPSRITFSVRSLNTKLDVNMFLPFFFDNSRWGMRWMDIYRLRKERSRAIRRSCHNICVKFAMNFCRVATLNSWIKIYYQRHAGRWFIKDVAHFHTMAEFGKS